MQDRPATESLVASVWDHPLVVARIATFLPPPFVSLQLRLASKEVSEQLDQYDTINVAKGMSGEDCMAALAVARSELTLSQRQLIMGAAAVYGDADALERVAEAAGCAPDHATMAVAARAGQLACCQRLVEMGCPEGGGLEAAASGGQREVCEWFLSRGAAPNAASVAAAVAAAASGGHVALMDVLYASWPNPEWADKWRVLKAVAHGCDKDTLRRVCTKLLTLPAEAGSWEARQLSELRAPAAGSPTRDWQDKLTWLQGASAAPPDSAAVCEAAARCPGAEAVARLQWLQQRGYPVTRSHAHPDCAVIQVGAISAAAASGNMEAFTRLREQGAPLPGRPVTVKLEGDANAAKSLRDVLPGLIEAGCPVYYFPTALHAAQRGDRKGLAWLVERFSSQPPPGVAPAQYPWLLKQAASAGSLQLLAWIKGWGAELNPALWEAAVRSGCEAALDWLNDNGPRPAPQAHYADITCCSRHLTDHLLCIPIHASDVSTLRALMRLGFPITPRDSILLADWAVEAKRWSDQHAQPSVQLLQLIMEQRGMLDGDRDEARSFVARMGNSATRKALFAWLRQVWGLPPARRG
ncbi:hypothetical protein HYH03_010209 [Edaphochlamys debaryana]|uniref:Ankyrin repeat domain-containing protein n=1 Tax=Edaphochlamys debaryana TaxID=47281 RepID=A0A835XZR5_9CHLO|nr:hypothetical protein HYH03_010209 [Edaphochlamys debaryana]|eukprot:KAG2491421.1 hypothetical protein HYH03_010209 [Edaphochlamys debaryana]